MPTVAASGALRTVAVSLFKIANDLRWLASGPRTAIAEIKLPELQPGSSIMPGKVNPVIPEMVMQVAAQVVGNDATVAWSAANGNFELNVMMPVLAHNLVESAELLASAATVLTEKAVTGHRGRCGASNRARGAEHHRGHGSGAQDRLRPRGQGCQGGVRLRSIGT